MDWRGIELAVPVYEILMLVVLVYAFITFYRRVKCGVLEKSGALWRYVLFVSTPIILIVLLFFTLVGFEELTHIGAITEGLARTILILVGLGLSIWLVSILIFGITLAFIKCHSSIPNSNLDSSA
jgi:chromate transport protein ChrA